MNLKIKAITAFNLGIDNLYRVLKYRVGVKTGLNSVHKLSAIMPNGQFYSQSEFTSQLPTVGSPKELTAFSYLEYSYSSTYPNWFYNPLTKHVFKDTQQPWYKIPDFNDQTGDIKGIWEASRFNWLIDFVLQEHIHQNGQAAILIDNWLNDWCHHNPAYLGPNWKCGQEASIRVMHLIAALIGLKQLEKPSNNVLKLIEVHLMRIAPTIEYAIAQDNNHGTSEATALFIGGELLNYFHNKSDYQYWAKLGRHWLENRAKKLIMEDGGFSQYSVNYHRVMLDSYCLAEIVRQQLQLPRFKEFLYDRLAKATEWLYILTQKNGDAPNLGANDGARLIPVAVTDYRDFRPTIQIASTLFCPFSYYQSEGSYDETLSFFELKKKEQQGFTLPDKNVYFHKSGLITAQQSNYFIAFKLPVFKFRPSQCDALHLDVWWKEINILRDGGTYSYNTSPKDLNYFSGVESHNTVAFDNHLQMPRLSRFLFGAWLKPKSLKYSKNEFVCGYQDYWKCNHNRTIKLDSNKIQVIDSISGFKHCAVLRWRLSPDSWILKENTITNGKITLQFESNEYLNIKLINGHESRYYFQKSIIPVIEMSVSKPCHIITTIQD